jgi:hypothetical protein
MNLLHPPILEKIIIHEIAGIAILWPRDKDRQYYDQNIKTDNTMTKR